MIFKKKKCSGTLKTHHLYFIVWFLSWVTSFIRVIELQLRLIFLGSSDRRGLHVQHAQNTFFVPIPHAEGGTSLFFTMCMLEPLRNRNWLQILFSVKNYSDCDAAFIKCIARTNIRNAPGQHTCQICCQKAELSQLYYFSIKRRV